MTVVSSKNIVSPAKNAGDFDQEHRNVTLQEVVDAVNAGNIDGPSGPKGPASATGATGHAGATGATRNGATGPQGPVDITSFIPPSTDPHVRGAVWNAGGLVGTKKLSISQG